MFREDQNARAKQIIAQKAAPLIHDGDVIFLDASSTVSFLIPHLEKLKDIVVITNSPKTSLCLGESKIRNYCTGGQLLIHSLAYVGGETERFISNFNMDIFLFSSRGYTEGGMITDSSDREVSAKRAMLQKCRHKLLFGRHQQIGKEICIQCLLAEQYCRHH